MKKLIEGEMSRLGIIKIPIHYYNEDKIKSLSDMLSGLKLIPTGSELIWDQKCYEITGFSLHFDFINTKDDKIPYYDIIVQSTDEEVEFVEARKVGKNTSRNGRSLDNP